MNRHYFEKPIYVTRPILPPLPKIFAKLEEVWDSQWLTNEGLQHRLLEQKLVEVLKVPYLSLFNNGTTALMVACQSLGLGGEVITTPFTFPATPHVLTWSKLKPVFCDIDPVTMNIDAGKIESLITPETSGILAVHVFGIPCDLTGIQSVADRHHLKVLYDAAHAFGVEVDGAGIGNYGGISMFSFHATKLFHTAEGGALTFKDKNLKSPIELLKNFGIKNEEEVIMPGINGKMNELHALLGLEVLNYLGQEKEKRKILLDTYHECLVGVEGLSFSPRQLPGIKSNHQYFVVRIEEKLFGCSRDRVYEEFKKYNVFPRKYFYPLCSNYPCYQALPSSRPDNLPVANRVARQVLMLPLYGGLGGEEVEQICHLLKSFRKERSGICRESA